MVARLTKLQFFRYSLKNSPKSSDLKIIGLLYGMERILR